MQHPWRKPLLITEFTALAILLGSMAWLSGQTQETAAVSPAWLLIPAVASLGVFASFIGLMYIRWIALADSGQTLRNKLVFALLALTLLGVWLYSVISTWVSLGQSAGA